MKLKYISALLTSLLLLASCSEDVEQQPVGGDGAYTYSFTAVLGRAETRLGYEEDSTTHNLKMVWDEGDVIRLYPDASMLDDKEYYEFTANTGAGTSHTVFVHQGYIKGWEHWNGKAIYTFLGEENLDVDTDEEKEAFLAKSRLQKSNGNTEHLKYAEHKREDDGTKKYTEYWSNVLSGYNLKHDAKLNFNHPYTVVYKIILRGFIYDIPNGSQLVMSGDAWPEVEESFLTLGVPESKENPGLFLKVGDYTNKYEKPSYTKEEYDDNALLTAYMIRQVNSGNVDAEFTKGQYMKFKLLAYDPNDGKVMIPLNSEDKQIHRQKGGGANYFTNIPWAEEYVWKVRLDNDVSYVSGDYIVFDLSGEISGGVYPDDDSNYDQSLPRVAVDMGHRVKWATYNVLAEAPDDYGKHFVWGYLRPTNGGFDHDDDGIGHEYRDKWKAGDPQYDVATYKWGSDWRMPDVFDLIDFFQYTDFQDRAGHLHQPEIYSSEQFWSTYWDNSNHQMSITESNSPLTFKNGSVVVKAVSKFQPSKTIYLPLAGRGDKRSAVSEIGTLGFYMASPIPAEYVSTTSSENKFNRSNRYISISKEGELIQAGSTTKINEKCYSVRPVKEASPAAVR